MECIRHLITHLRSSEHFPVYHDYDALSGYETDGIRSQQT